MTGQYLIVRFVYRQTKHAIIRFSRWSQGLKLVRGGPVWLQAKTAGGIMCWQDLGSLQKRRVCRRLDDTVQSRHLTSQLSPPSNLNRRSDYGDLDTFNYEAKTEGPVPAHYTETMHGTMTNGRDQSQTSQLNMHDLSYILHPSHESTTSSHDQNESPGFDDGAQGGLCRQACTELGVSQTTMNQM